MATKEQIKFWNLLDNARFGAPVAKAQESISPTTMNTITQEVEDQAEGVPSLPVQPASYLSSYSMGYSGPTKEERMLQKQIEEQTLQGIENRKSQVDFDKQNLLAALKNQGGLAGTDLNPLFATARMLGAKGAGQGYTAPETMTPEKVAALSKVIQSGEGALTDDQTNLLKLKLMNAQSNSAGIRQAGTQDRFIKAQEGKFYTDLRKDTQDINDKLAGAHQSIFNVESAMTPDANGEVSAARIEAALANFATLMGNKGVLTDQDITRQLANNMELKLARAKQWITSNPADAKVPASVTSAIVDALKDAKEGIAMASKYKVSQLESVYGEQTAPTASMYYQRGGKKVVDKLKERWKLDSKEANADQNISDGGDIIQKAKAEMERRKSSNGSK